MKTLDVTTCPACGSGDASDFPYGEEWSLRRCARCELVYAPLVAHPEEIYVDGYLTGGSDFGLDGHDPTLQQYLGHVARLRMEHLERVLGSHRGTFLDVGCGAGEVLVAARDHGWTVQGADPVPESAEFARTERSLDVRPTTLEESGFPERSYDVVSAFHVLEHMTDGAAFLRLLARWARPGGHLVIEVPNWRSLHRVGARTVNTTWPSLRPLEHVAHYTPATLDATLRRVGLEPLSVVTRSYLWGGQSTVEQLRNVGLQRYKRWTPPLSRIGERDGQPLEIPNLLGRVTLRAVERAEDRLGYGMVVLAVARVP